MTFLDLFKNTVMAEFTTDFYIKTTLYSCFYRNDQAGAIILRFPLKNCIVRTPLRGI